MNLGINCLTKRKKKESKSYIFGQKTLLPYYWSALNDRGLTLITIIIKI